MFDARLGERCQACIRGRNRQQSLIVMVIDQHPIGRIEQPDDGARAVAFLLDPANSFPSDAMAAVDGGQIVD